MNHGSRIALLPSRLTALRTLAGLSVAEAAVLVGLIPSHLQYLEDHTRRVPPSVFKAYRQRIEPIRWCDAQPISIWEWLAERERATEEEPF